MPRHDRLRAALGFLLAVLASFAARSAPAEDPPKAPVRPEAAPPAAAKGLVAVDAYFRGKVVRVEGRTIELAYDFESADQMRDFEPSLPFRAIRSIAWSQKNGRAAVTGTGSLRHSAVFSGPVALSGAFTPRRPRDFGFAITEDRESEVFTLYCVYDRYFSAGDNVHVPQNMIIKFIPRDPKVNKDGWQDWRYCGSRGQDPEIAVGRTYKVSAARDGIESSMRIDDWESKGREAGRDLTAQRVGIYGYDAQFDVDDLRIRGTLDPEWVARTKLDLAGWKPPVPPPAANGGADPASPAVSDAAAERIRAKIAAYPAETKPPALAAMLRDASIPVPLRAEAAERAKAVGSKRIVPFLVDGLYAADADARRLSADVVKSLLGKNFGYRHDAAEEARKKAIQGLNDYLQKHPEEFL